MTLTNTSVSVIVSERLRAARLVSGLRLRDIADQTGIPACRLAILETNGASMQMRELYSLTKVLGELI